MKISSLLCKVVTTCTFAFAAQASATPTLLVDSNGLLIGANNVDVGGVIYNVTFADGSCNSLFNGCTSTAFAFHTPSDASLAAQALLDQVFIDGPAGQFDSHPEKTLGCSSVDQCATIIPYNTHVVFSRFVDSVLDINSSASNGNFDTTIGFFDFASSDTAFNIYQNYAIFELAPRQVPEPSSSALIGVAMAGLAFARRRKQQN